MSSWSDENQLRVTTNTTATMDYYEQLQKFFDEDTSQTLTKLRSYSLYAPRQVISDFLVKYELFKMILDVPGSVLEFGVFNGQGLFSFGHMSAILEPNNISRRIFGFDTFSGFSGITDKDLPDGRIVREGGYSIDSFARLSKAIELFDQNRFIGHIPKIELICGDVTKSLDKFLTTQPQVIPALVYLDLDIYQPTKLVLERLISRMPQGAVVAFDELNHPSYPGETSAFLEVLKPNQVSLKRFPFCSRISYFRI
jgi:hypothetical protein